MIARKRFCPSAGQFSAALLGMVAIASAHVASAAPLDTEQALDLITQTADRICNVVSTKGEVESAEVKGQVQAQLSGLAAKLANAGVSGTGGINNEQYQNVLRQDLASTLHDNVECRLKVFHTLQARIISPPPPVPVPPPPPPPPSTTTTNGFPSRRDVYFNKPDILYYEEPDEIKLAVEPKQLNEMEIDVAFEGLYGKVIHKNVKSGAFLTASLSAPKSLLEITAEDDRVRKVTGGTTIIFVWYVTPMKIGTIPIRLDLMSQDNASKDSPVNTIQVMQEEWVADARGMSWLKYQIVEFQPIGVAICGVGAAIASTLGFFGLKLFGEKAKSGNGG